MWTGKIARTERNGTQLDIIFSFTNGVGSFDKTISTDKAQNSTWLDEQISSTLNQLNGLDQFEQAIRIADKGQIFTASVEAIAEAK